MTGHESARFVDVRQVQRSFSRVAAGFDEASFLSREVDRRMLECLDYVRIEPGHILDLGCSTGASLRALRERYRHARLTGADFALPMLQAAAREKRFLSRLLPFVKTQATQFVAADAEALPFARGQFGLVWSNLLLHWLNEPRPAFREVHRTLEVGGLFMFSTFGPDTLRELVESFGDGDAHAQRFTDMHDLGDMLVECGFSDPVMDMEVLTLTYASVDDLVRELRAAGDVCAMRARRQGLGGRQQWERVRMACQRMADNDNAEGRFPVRFELVYGHAWKAAPKVDESGRAIIRFGRKA